MRFYILSGAGLSADSGIPTFRDGGLWDEVSIEEVATHEAWLSNPAKVIAFFDARRQELARYQPNSMHKFLATLPNAVHLTQNVDDLYERAGGKPIHLHGKLTEIRCETCQKIYDIGYNPQPKKCKFCGGERLRPNVVLFGEMAPNYRHLYTIEADIFIAIGTSGAVIDIADIAQKYPVSILIDPKRRKRVTMFGEFDEYIDEYFTHYIPKGAIAAIEDLQKLLKETYGSAHPATK